MVHKLSDNMVSKEPNVLPTVHSQSNGNPDKTGPTVTVRSVLLNRNSPDIENRLKRRRNRTQQVRFKDLEDDESKDKNDKIRSKSPTEVPNWQKELMNGPSLVGSVRGDMEKTIGAVTAFLKRAPPHPLTPGPTRRCWVPTHPCSLTLPLPSQPCRSTAIQTSPSLQKPPSLSATQTRSHSFGDGVGESWDDEESSDELTARVYFPLRRSHQRDPGQQNSPAEQSRCQKTEDNRTASLDTTTQSLPPHKHSRRRGRRKLLNRAASDPGKPESPCTCPSETSDRKHEQSNQSKKTQSKGVAHRTSNVPLHRSPTPNILHHVPCSVYSTQSEPSCNAKIQTFSDHTDSWPSQTAAPPAAEAHQTLSTCPKETQNVPSQCGPPQAVSPSLTQAEHRSLTPSVSQTLCFTTTQVTLSSTHGQSSMSLSEASVRCCTPAVQTVTNCKTPPVPESCCISEYRTEPVNPVRSSPGCQILAECFSNIGKNEPSCSQGSSVVASSFSFAHPRQKTLTKPMACYNIPIQPVPSVIPPTQSVPNSKVPDPSLPAPYCVPDIQTVQTTTLTTHTPTPNQSTIQPPIQSVPYCVKDKSAAPASSHSEPMLSHKVPTQTLLHSVMSFPPGPPYSHLKTSIPGVSHIIPIAQTTVHCILDPQNAGTDVTPSLPVLICSWSTQPSPGAMQTLAHCNAAVQSAASCGNPPQIVQNFKTPPQTVPHSKSFPQNMSPVLSSREAVTYIGVPQETVLPNFRHSLPPYACPPQTALLYSNTGASPLPAQAFCSTQDRRDRREFMLPPPPPPPPPYTPRKEGSSTPGQPCKPPVAKVDCNNAEKDKAKAGTTKSKGEARTDEIPPPIPPKSKARAMVKPTCLGSRRAILGTESQCNANLLPSSAGPNPQAPLGPAEGQADTLRQVQELLGGLMSGAKCKLDLSKAKEKLFGPNGPLYDIGTLQSQLHSLEGVLETSQNTIKVLLDVIQDLEKKEAERDGRHSYRTGQDIENCGTCRDCACIIYSVEHDFRLQEGQVTRAWKVPEQQESEQSSPQLVFHPPRQQESPQALQTVKKSRRKCFWFL
ncbi:proline-rich protein 36 isoform X3 [Triplophysa rosa]|uniref:proline-rich protein 36 isoform X3 n=1 Tax=Triplophysa rosa TaxID=992332 RepID=UPI0025461081|nr:proline-rich protein 36 isoform X3 [Triplophysa rosa]